MGYFAASLALPNCDNPNVSRYHSNASMAKSSPLESHCLTQAPCSFFRGRTEHWYSFTSYQNKTKKLTISSCGSFLLTATSPLALNKSMVSQSGPGLEGSTLVMSLLWRQGLYGLVRMCPWTHCFPSGPHYITSNSFS